jgi:hypothetical protein
LRSGISLVAELGVAGKICLRVRQLGPVAVAIGCELLDLGLVWTGIYLCKQIAGLDRLALGEGDLDDLSLDLTAHDVSVVGDHRAYAAQVNRDIPASDRGSDHWDCGRRRQARCGRPGSLAEVPDAPAAKGSGEHDQHDNEAAFHGGVPLMNLRDGRNR